MRKRDFFAWGIALSACLVSIVAFIITDKLGGVLLYKDSISHMEIARRVVDGSSNSHAAQLGGVWLPLPHLLMLPFVWSNTLYHDGIAGAISSMVAYVTATVLAYKIVYRLSGDRFAGVVAAIVFGINANMLYMQSTPMTEALLFACLLGMVYCVQQWADTNNYRYLVMGGVSTLLGILSRYESWPVFACLLMSVIVIAWTRRPDGLTPKQRRARVRDRFLVFMAFGLVSVGGWMLWCWAILGSPVYFQDGQYAKPSLWVSSSDPVVGHLWVAIKTYWYAMGDNETYPLLILAAVGLVVLLARERHSLTRALPVLSLLIVVPFYVVSLDKGQRPLYVTEMGGSYYNVRFGLVVLLPVALLIGYLVGSMKRAKPLVYAVGALILLIVVGANAELFAQNNVVTYKEAASATNQVRTVEQNEVITYLRGHYNGGRVLLESFSNELVTFWVPSAEDIYEGSYKQWQNALRDPSTDHIAWIIDYCGRDDPDKVCDDLSSPQGKSELRSYNLVYTTPDGNYHVYEAVNK